MNLAGPRFLVAVLGVAIAPLSPAEAARTPPSATMVRDVAKALMKEAAIPGLAVGIITPNGHAIYTFGIASKDTRKPVTRTTLFEIGSISKTFTATLAAFAQVKGKLALQDKVTKFLPELQGSALDGVSLLNLATHTTGGMPLQFPDTVTNREQMLDYFRHWKPTEKPGTSRTYANPSIGLLGLASAKALSGDFTQLMEGTLYPALGLANTFLDVPEAEQARYAQGYTRKNVPIRVTPGVLDKEAYGVRTTITDLTHFVELNMGIGSIDGGWARAIAQTHQGYYRLGAMTQALVWEEYAYPVNRQDLLKGNSSAVASEANAVTAISPPAAASRTIWINKTGSTNGFGAYVAFVPEAKLGVVILANKYCPNEARIKAAYQLLTSLARHPGW